MHDDVFVVHSDYRALMQLTVALGEMRYRITSVESHAPLRTARAVAPARPAAMIVALDGTENVVEIREILSAGASVRFVFLAPRMPPRAPLARLVNGHGSTIVGRDEPPVVIASTLVSLLVQRSLDCA